MSMQGFPRLQFQIKEQEERAMNIYKIPNKVPAYSGEEILHSHM